ncbi:MAG: hypothetical protein QM817_13075 [Archangium sp.]
MQALTRFAFWLRNQVPLSAPAWKSLASLESMRAELDADRLALLAARYPSLQRWNAICSAQDWRESLYVLDVLRQHLPRKLPAGRALDVGSKNGTYLPGLVTAQPRGWDACELDAHRRYAWGATRRAYGERMASAFEGCEFHARDVRELEGPWSLVTWFLPFLSEGPLDAWGVPRTHFAPASLLDHVAKRLVPGGVMLIVNQGEREAELQEALLRATPSLSYEKLGAIESPLSPFRSKRFGFLAQTP